MLHEGLKKLFDLGEHCAKRVMARNEFLNGLFYTADTGSVQFQVVNGLLTLRVDAFDPGDGAEDQKVTCPLVELGVQRRVMPFSGPRGM